MCNQLACAGPQIACNMQTHTCEVNGCCVENQGTWENHIRAPTTQTGTYHTSCILMGKHLHTCPSGHWLISVVSGWPTDFRLPGMLDQVWYRGNGPIWQKIAFPGYLNTRHPIRNRNICNARDLEIGKSSSQLSQHRVCVNERWVSQVVKVFAHHDEDLVQIPHGTLWCPFLVFPPWKHLVLRELVQLHPWVQTPWHSQVQLSRHSLTSTSKITSQTTGCIGKNQTTSYDAQSAIPQSDLSQR